MGGMILIASVIVWFLSYYPRTDETAGTETHYANSYLGRLGKGVRTGVQPAGIQLEGQRGAVVGLPGQGDRGLDAGRALLRRRRDDAR